MAQLNFDASQVAPSTGVADPIPAAWYNAAITESSVKPTNDGTGTILALVFTILDGAYANRKVYINLNIKNANPTAQEIAYKDLSAIAHAVGVLQVPNSEVLHNRPMKVKVKIRPAKGDYDASNAISSYKNINEQVAMGGATAAPSNLGVQPPAQQQVQMPPQQQQFQQAQQQPFQQPAQQPMQQQQFAQQQPAQQQQVWQQPAAQQPWQQQQPVQQQPEQHYQQQQPVQQQQPNHQQMQQHPAQQYVDPNAQAQMQQQFQQPVQQPAMQQPVQQQMQQQPVAGGNPATGVMPPWVQQ